MTIQELNDKYFSLYGDLFAAKNLLPKSQYETTARALFNDYCQELEVVVGEKELQVGQYIFELRFRLKNYLPRGFLFFRNKFARRLLKQLKAEFLAELSAMKLCAKEIKDETKAVQTSGQQDLQETALSVQNDDLPK